MEFKKWLEVTFDPKTTHAYKYNVGDRTWLGKSFHLKIDANGKVAPLEKEDWDKGYFEISPNSKQIKLQKISPQSTDFRKLINAIRSKYLDIDD